jgi:predicted ATPase
MDTGMRLLRTGLLQEAQDRFSTLCLTIVQTAGALRRAGKIAEGLAIGEAAIRMLESHVESWQTAELLRANGEFLLSQGADGAAVAAEAHFRQALDWARRQDALSWELRAATSLARLQRDQGRSDDAFTCLQPVFARFTEGFETADLKSASALLESLQ